MIESAPMSDGVTSGIRRSTAPRWRLLALILLPSLALDFLLVSQRLPLGIKDQWVWQYQLDRPPWFSVLFPVFAGPVILLVALYAAERFDLRQFGRGATVACLLALAASSYLFRFFVQWIAVPTSSGPTFAAATVASDMSTSHFTVARNAQDVRQLVAEFPMWMARWPRHAKTHPPGTVLIYVAVHRTVTNSEPLQQFVRRAFYPEGDPAISRGLFGVERMAHTKVSVPELMSATLIAYLLPLFGALSVLPFFYLARRLLGDAWAWRAAVILTTLPSLAVFFYAIDQVYFFLSTMFLALWCAALDRRSVVLAGLAGVMLGVALFTTYSLLPLIFLAGVLTLAWSRERTEARGPARLLLGSLGGLLGFYLLLFLIFRFNPVATLRAALAAHREVTLQEMPRSYGRWLFANLLDFFFFVGVPSVLLLLAQFRQARDPAQATERWQSWSLVAFGTTLLALDLSGLVRGEVARIWMYLGVFPVLFAAARLQRESDPQWAHFMWIVVCCVQLLQIALMQHAVGIGFLKPW